MAEEVRLREPDRKQLILRPTDIEGLIGPDHGARALWRVLQGMDLSRFCAAIKARANTPGRDATDPRLLLALWIYALSEGVGAAREIERLCQAHDAYRWICGGVSVNYHTLSDFRVAHREALDELMAQILAALMAQGLVRLYRVAQDGTRVRASAGAASFRRQKTLKRCLAEARRQIAALQDESADPQRSGREQAARERAAREREQRCLQALKQLEQLSTHKARAKNHPQRETETRVSITDPQARVMKMADHGYRPAYNLQFAIDTEDRIVAGVCTSNSGSDSKQLEPMLDDIQERSGLVPDQHLADGGFMNFGAVERAAERGVEVFCPPRENRTYHIDPLTPQPGDSPAIADYRRRMGSPQGKTIYKERASTVETLNADLKTWRGLDRLLVRGIGKVHCVALLSAITYNLLRAIKMGWL